MLVLFVEADSSAGTVGIALGSKRVEEVVGYMADSRNAVTLVLDHGTVDWDQVEDTSNLCRPPYLGPALCPCPFVPGGGSHVRGNLDVVVVEVVVGTLVG